MNLIIDLKKRGKFSKIYCSTKHYVKVFRHKYKPNLSVMIIKLLRFIFNKKFNLRYNSNLGRSQTKIILAACSLHRAD